MKRRGWIVRRALLVADVAGLMVAFLLAELASRVSGPRTGDFLFSGEVALFLATIPGWIVLSKLYGLYDRDEERTDHTTVDDVIGVFHVVTVGAWLSFAGAWLSGLAAPDLHKVAVFWASAITLVVLGRLAARAFCQRHFTYLQNTVIVGAGDVGQLVARKFLRHREYGINVVGFVDSSPKERCEDFEHLTLLGPPERLGDIVERYDVERVVIAFSNESDEATLGVVRMLRGSGIQIDVVPRLYEVVGPNVEVHSVEGLPLVGLPPARLSRSSSLLKRAIDVVGALIGLVLTVPLLAYIAWRIKRDSPGPVFFRQTRLGKDMKEFSALKFRTMRVDTNETDHRSYIESTMSPLTPLGPSGLYKLEREDAVTDVGRWLRRRSLDELPQLINVLRGEMSLVGPRPCIPYEVEHFAQHHYERFLMPAGMTGLWQVTARARSTFGEALDMDVAYVQGWSLGLDLRLLCRTPVQMLSRRRTA